MSPAMWQGYRNPVLKALMAGEGTATYKDLVTNLACEIIKEARGNLMYLRIWLRNRIEPIARGLYSSYGGLGSKGNRVYHSQMRYAFAEWVGNILTGKSSHFGMGLKSMP